MARARRRDERPPVTGASQAFADPHPVGGQVDRGSTREEARVPGGPGCRAQGRSNASRNMSAAARPAGGLRTNGPTSTSAATRSGASAAARPRHRPPSSSPRGWPARPDLGEQRDDVRPGGDVVVVPKVASLSPWPGGPSSRRGTPRRARAPGTGSSSGGRPSPECTRRGADSSEVVRDSSHPGDPGTWWGAALHSLLRHRDLRLSPGDWPFLGYCH